ncbi:uncharacterized protein LOC121390048 [Gigantopelta aegis]|uniref:uncharacterized protein LOC121390048 n=1 Tax=Gigantopelta aegis TaxID=1735272 RepID=UPI001B887D65|nr:uncharacterized protein LOC121390048 [Gigantopelta aegis]
MLLFVLILTVCGISVRGECQGDFNQRMLSCNQIIRRPMRFSDIGNLDPEEKQRVCTNAHAAMICALDIVNDCIDSPQLKNGRPLEARASLQSSLQRLSNVCGP